MMPYEIVTHDVDLTPEEQEMAEAILRAGQQADIQLAPVETEAWRIFLNGLAVAVRIRIGRPPGGMAGPLPGGQQIRFYRVERVEVNDAV